MRPNGEFEDLIGTTFTATHAYKQLKILDAIAGTADYVSPEQVRGQPADARSDVFSFGTVLYEIITGRRPFQRETPADTMAAILKEPHHPFAKSQPPCLHPTPTSSTNASKRIRKSDSQRPKSWPMPCAH